MTQKQSKPYGSWLSPISTSLVLSPTSISLVDVLVTPQNSLVWIEGRPNQAGRNAIVSKSLSTRGGESGEEEVIGETKWNARTRVHEYGGASVCLGGASQDSVIFSDIKGPLYQVQKEKNGEGWRKPEQVTPDDLPYRYADFTAHPSALNSHVLISVLEDHTHDTPADVVNSLVLIDTKDKKVHPIVLEGGVTDFVSCPRFSASGKYICYVTWNHPSMPWEGSTLHVSKVNYDPTSNLINLAQPLTAGSTIKIAGSKEISVSQPRWSLAGVGGEKERLVYLCDKTGFSELYAWEEGAEGEGKLLLGKVGGYDVGGPDWTFGASTHCPLSATHHIFKSPSGQLTLLDLVTKLSTVISTPYISISMIRRLSPTSVVLIGSSSDKGDEISILDLPTEEVKAIKLASPDTVGVISSGSIARAREISYPSTIDGKVVEAKAIWYEPTSLKYVGVDGEKAPLVVHCHGGPTSAAGKGLNWSIQYFTSRGFAYVDVNYGGSTGYGRDYRQRLQGQWGIVDVQDTIACVEYLVSKGWVDGKRVSITGGSAGGFTVLAALCAGKVFGAGTSLYGVSDLALLASDTHKFESQYLFGLIGGTPEEVPDAYFSRSPINNAPSISSPLLILQGSEDRVVPPAQATVMAEAIRANGGECEIIIFEGEGHGFRISKNKERAMQEELSFYRKTFGIEGGKE